MKESIQLVKTKLAHAFTSVNNTINVCESSPTYSSFVSENQADANQSLIEIIQIDEKHIKIDGFDFKEYETFEQLKTEWKPPVAK